MTDDPPFVSVVVPTWNRARHLDGALRSLLGQDYPADRYEVVVVDDGSIDDTRAVVERTAAAAPDRRVRYVRRPNGGINAARNTGIDAAAGSLVSMLDDDELAPPEHLSRLAAALTEHLDAAGAGGPYLDAPGPGVRTCATCSLGAASIPDGPGLVTRLLGGNMTLRRSALEAVGRFAEGLSGRGDENEWFRRAERAGLRFWYDDSLFVWHRRDTMTLRDLCRSQLRQGRSLPRSRALSGDPYRPRPGRIPRLLAHAARRRCGKGVVLAAREVGATQAWLGLKLRRRVS